MQTQINNINFKFIMDTPCNVHSTRVAINSQKIQIENTIKINQ